MPAAAPDSGGSLLHNLSQQIHATLLSPPRRFLLITSTPPPPPTPDSATWILTLFVKDDQGKVIAWSTEIDLTNIDIENRNTRILDAVNDGLLHVDVGTKRSIDLNQLKQVELYILVPGEPLVFNLTSCESGDHIHSLVDSAFELLNKPSKPVPKSNGDTTSELRELRAQLTQKDAEIASLSSKLASMKATVVRATASDNKKKGVNASPQKAKPPKGASALQPNQKRRKAVEDEFAGSSDEDED